MKSQRKRDQRCEKQRPVRVPGGVYEVLKPCNIERTAAQVREAVLAGKLTGPTTAALLALLCLRTGILPEEYKRKAAENYRTPSTPSC
jgi:hypothetical protein